MTPVGDSRQRFSVKFYLVVCCSFCSTFEAFSFIPGQSFYAKLKDQVRAFRALGDAAVHRDFLVGFFYIWKKGVLDWGETSPSEETSNALAPAITDIEQLKNHPRGPAGRLERGGRDPRKVRSREMTIYVDRLSSARLARFSKMIRVPYNFSFRHYLRRLVSDRTSLRWSITAVDAEKERIG